MEFKVEPKKMESESLVCHYRNEVMRVEGAIKDAREKLDKLKHGIILLDSKAKIAELTGALNIGEMYLKALKVKLNNL